MSLDASVWAWKQCPGTASVKLVLLSLADRASEDHVCYPSIERLAKDTHLNRKTVFSCLKKLQELGLIEDTGERKGKTAQVKAYRLVGVMGRHDSADEKSGQRDPKKEHSQKRNSSKKGTVPKQDEKSPNIGSEKSPNSGTQNQSVEPIREPEETSEPDGRTSDPPPEQSPPETEKHPDAAIQDGKRWGTAQDLELAHWIGERVDAYLQQDAPPRRNMATWANDIRLMREQDGRQLKHIKALFWWAHNNSFWRPNIRSPAKLRDHWSHLAAQRKEEREAFHAARQSGSGKGGIDYTRVDW